MSQVTETAWPSGFSVSMGAGRTAVIETPDGRTFHAIRTEACIDNCKWFCWDIGPRYYDSGKQAPSLLIGPYETLKETAEHILTQEVCPAK